ncbi:MAG: tetratricopeptide repeat protein [Planctomycetota bacterium]
MPERTLIVPKFRSLEEFSTWWQRPDIIHLQRSLQEHPHIKPWLAQLQDTQKTEEIAPSVSKEFGRYILERKLGEGGMGVVYLALDPALNRRVALKILSDKSPEAIQRFMREAESTAKLKHPHIIQVYEVGGISHNYYFTMEYVEGTSLDALISEKKLHPRRAAEIICDIASALHYAHTNNLIHRDIKPSNILIDSQGRTYLTDFGLAKETTGLERALTMSGTVLGTPEYMSPEQATGDKNRTDQRSDIFSLGATLYHSLTGQSPFKGDDLYQVLEAVMHKDPLPPKRLVPVLSRDIETICMKCLDKEPARRYQNAQELADDLKRFLNGEEILARPTGFITRIWRKSKRNRAASLAMAGAVVILIGVAIWMQIAKADRITDYRTKARKSFEIKRFEDTLTWSKQILELSPTDNEARRLLKESQLALNKRNEARKVLERSKSIVDADEKIKMLAKALEIDPAFAEAWQEIGYTYNRQNDYRNAHKAFSKAIAVDKALVNSYFARAHIAKVINKDYKGAAADFAKVLELDPESYMGYFAKGAIELHNGDYKQAIADFTRVIELKPDDVDAYDERAKAYLRRGQRGLALSDWNKAIEINPDFASAYYSRGDIYLADNKLDLALKDFNKYVELNPQEPAGYCIRAIIYTRMGRLDLALADANKAVEINPDNADMYYRRADLYYQNENNDEAIADYSRAIELDPKCAEAYFGRAACYGLKGQLDEVIMDCNKAIELKPALAHAYTTRGAAYLDKGDLDRALGDLNKTIELAPEYPNAYFHRGFAYYQTNDCDRAIADYSRAIKIDPKEFMYYLKRADAYGFSGKYTQAVSDYTKAIELAPRKPAGYKGRGMAYCFMKNFDRALPDLDKALELGPKDPVAYYWRGMVRYQRDELDLAIADFTKTIKFEPKSAEAYRDRAYAYAGKKDYDKAIADGEMFVKLTPDEQQRKEVEWFIGTWRSFRAKESKPPAK